MVTNLLWPIDFLKKRLYKITLIDCFLLKMPFLLVHVTFALKFKSITHLMIKACNVFPTQQAYSMCQILFLKFCKSRWYRIIWPNLFWFSIVVNIWIVCRQIYEILGARSWIGSIFLLSIFEKYEWFHNKLVNWHGKYVSSTNVSRHTFSIFIS